MEGKKIKCPQCGAEFEIDETGYNQILQQVRNAEFTKEIDQYKQSLEEMEKKERENVRLQTEGEFEKIIKEKDNEIISLQGEMKNLETQNELALNKTIHDKDDEIAKLKKSYDDELRDKDTEIERYKNFTSKQSTKMIGESLEQHCQDEFNTFRMAAFPKAYFEKDNKVSKESGSKGDYIFRDFDDDGNEIISIMFDMKNEMDTTATKKKNEHFFKELDKDRNEKKCEYAVLVSLLEADSDLYNVGIVDVSYKYPKMYVIRPQFFLTIITLLKNAAEKSLEYKKELQEIRAQQLDFTHFEENMNKFQTRFSKDVAKASTKFDEAIKEIDNAIKNLQKTKENLLSSEKSLQSANDKAENLSIKELTQGAPSVRHMLEEASSHSQEE